MPDGTPSGTWSGRSNSSGATDEQGDAAQAIVEQVRRSRKYRHLDPALIQDVARRELAKGRSRRQAVKATKSQLHQSAAVYFQPGLNYGQALADLARAGSDLSAVRAALGQVMAGHASTRERLPYLDRIYLDLFQRLPPIQSVLDVACGLHPLARSWMPLPSTATYLAWDVFSDQMDFLQQVFALLGWAGEAIQRNVLVDAAGPAVDVAFVLKTLPCLEQLDRGAGQRLLQQINARWLIVSFPRQSLGGRGKGMTKHYDAGFTALVETCGWSAERLQYPNEQFYIVDKGAA